MIINPMLIIKYCIIKKTDANVYYGIRTNRAASRYSCVRVAVA